MTVESDLEAFRDLALERQIRIQSSSEPRDKIIAKVYEDLEPILEEIVGNNPILVTGRVFTASRFPERFDIDPNYAKDSAFGESKGLLVADRTIIDPSSQVTPESFIIGFLVALSSETDEVDYRFAPIEISSISVPDLEIYDASSLTPDSNDLIAESIDLCILNEPVNIALLNELFNSSNLTELSLDFYIDYLNNTFKPSEYELTFVTEDLVELTSDYEFSRLLEPGTELSAACMPIKFIFSSSFGGLCIVFKSVERKGVFLLPVVALRDAKFTSIE